MQKREIKRLDQSVTNGQEKAQASAKAGRKSYSSKSRKASKPSRKKDGRVSDAKKQRGGQRRQAFKLADLLTDETIKKLRGIKEAEKENGRTNPKRPTSRK